MLSDPHVQIMGLHMGEDWINSPPMKLMMKMDNIMTTRQKKVVFSLFHGTLPIKINGFYFLNQPKFLSVCFRGTRDWADMREHEARAADEWEKHHATFAELGIDPERAGCSDTDPPPFVKDEVPYVVQ